MRLGLVAAVVLGLSCQNAPDVRPSAQLSERESIVLALHHGEGARVVEPLEKLWARTRNDVELARMLAEAHVQAHTGDALLTRLAADDSAVSHYMQGLVRFSRASEASGAAVVEFQRAAQLAPSEPEFVYRLGIALVESERYEDALVPLRRAVELAPAKTGWSLPLAKALVRTGNSAGAVAAIRTVVAGNPTPTEVTAARTLMDQIADPFAFLPQAARPRLEQALQWLEAGDVPQQAIIQLEELLLEFPEQAGLHALLGLSYLRLDDAGRAADELQRAIELAPQDGKNELYLAQLYLSRQRPKSAVDHLNRAVELNPVLDEAWFNLGEYALAQQDYVTARRQFEIATRLRPDSVSARGKLALVYQLEKNWPAADRELHAVLDHDPENVEFMLRLGVLHTERYSQARNPTEKAEAAKEASSWLEKVLAVQPENALASRALERVRGR